MFKNYYTPIFTLTFTIVSLWWAFDILVSSSVMDFYHPNLANANWGSRYKGTIGLIAVANWLIVVWQMNKSTTEEKFVWLFLGAGILASLFFTLNHLKQQNRDHIISYYIENDNYLIPWEYNPINGSYEKGGTYFVIHVSYPGFFPQYKDRNYRENSLIVSRHTKDSKYGKQTRTGTSLNNNCLAKRTCEIKSPENYQFSDGEFVYGIHYQGQRVKFKSQMELDRFRMEIVGIFESFRN